MTCPKCGSVYYCFEFILEQEDSEYIRDILKKYKD